METSLLVEDKASTEYFQPSPLPLGEKAPHAWTNFQLRADHHDSGRSMTQHHTRLVKMEIHGSHIHDQSEKPLVLTMPHSDAIPTSRHHHRCEHRKHNSKSHRSCRSEAGHKRGTRPSVGDTGTGTGNTSYNYILDTRYTIPIITV